MLIVSLLRAVIVDHNLDDIGRPVQVKIGTEALNLHSSHIFSTCKLARLTSCAEGTCDLEFSVIGGLRLLCPSVTNSMSILDFN